MGYNKTKFFLLCCGVVFLLIVLIVLFFVFCKDLGIFSKEIGSDFNSVESVLGVNKKNECVKRIEQFTVLGNSMSPFIKNGQVVMALFGYYECNPVERNDVILFSYAGEDNPLIKFVKGIPGDLFFLKRDIDFSNLYINNSVVVNTEGVAYRLDNQGYTMLSLYEHDYRGVIPQNAYLILGNSPTGSLDSERFGLVGKTDILAKVILVN